jgi:hypothetical protein
MQPNIDPLNALAQLYNVTRLKEMSAQDHENCRLFSVTIEAALIELKARQKEDEKKTGKSREIDRKTDKNNRQKLFYTRLIYIGKSGGFLLTISLSDYIMS